MNSLLASKLYKEANLDEAESPHQLNMPRTGYFHEYFVNIFQCRRNCCRRTRQQQVMNLARKALIKEIDVVELIRMHRYFNRVVEKVLSQDDRAKLRKEESFKIIDPDKQQPWW